MTSMHPTTFTTSDSPLGRILLVATPLGIRGLWFTSGQRNAPDPAAWRRDDDHPVLAEATVQLADYFSCQRSTFDLPLDLSAGTPFQQSVWRALRNIPFGRTITYGDLADRIGQPRAVRAAAAAIGRNPIGIIIPCHRVVGANGALTGYAGGLERKSALLQLEASSA